jgi:hypothetical protein
MIYGRLNKVDCIEEEIDIRTVFHTDAPIKYDAKTDTTTILGDVTIDVEASDLVAIDGKIVITGILTLDLTGYVSL